MFSLLSRRVCTIPIHFRPLKLTFHLRLSLQPRRGRLTWQNSSSLVVLAETPRSVPAKTTMNMSRTCYSLQTLVSQSLTHSLQLFSSHNKLSAPSSGARRQYAFPVSTSPRTDAVVSFFQLGQSPRLHGTTSYPSARRQIIIFVPCRKAPTFMWKPTMSFMTPILRRIPEALRASDRSSFATVRDVCPPIYPCTSNASKENIRLLRGPPHATEESTEESTEERFDERF